MNIEFKRKRPTDRQGALRKEVWNMKRRAVELRTFESISMSPCQLERTRALVLRGGIIQSGQIQIQIHSVWASICGWQVSLSQFQVPVNEVNETQTRNLNSSLQVGVLSGGGLCVFAQRVMGKYSFTRASIHL